MLLKEGQKGFDPVLIEYEKYLNELEHEEYSRLEAECSAESERIIKESIENNISWEETSSKISKVNKKRTARMFEILEKAMNRV